MGSNLVDPNGQINPGNGEAKVTGTTLTIVCNGGYSVLDADGNMQSSVTKLLVCDTDQDVHDDAEYTLPTCEGKNTTLHYTSPH